MRARFLTIMTAFVPALALALAGGPAATAAPAVGVAASSPARPLSGAASPVHVKHACDAPPAAGRMQCLALLRVNSVGQPLVSTGVSATQLPFGYGPRQLQSAYQLVKAAASRGGSQTVAVVDAYDDPNAEADLAVYRAEYGLPACTTANGCFRKVNQEGAASPLPTPDPGWAVEESLDLEMVSAACPHCHIILAEANDSTDTNVAATVSAAARLGATEISNSYGEPEYTGERQLEPFYDYPGVQLTASAGDSGYGVSYPAASAHVTAVGGTALWPAGGGRGWKESAWAGTGSGCSTVIVKPAWQHDSCAHRMVADVAAVASPDTPVAVYDTYQVPGWVMVAGTSVSAPIVAGVYALMGDPHSAGGSYYYSHRSHLFDVTSGFNGTCFPSYQCTARRGYDGPTGLGTPDFTGISGAGGSCAGHWRTASPSPVDALLDGPQQLGGLDAVSRNNVWGSGTFYGRAPASVAVGASGIIPNGRLPFIEHWNGRRWSYSPSPVPVQVWYQINTYMRQLSFDRRDDGWAAATNDMVNVMVEHWNGKRWSLSPALSPLHTYAADNYTERMVAEDHVMGLKAFSPHNVWLAGHFYDLGLGPVGTFVEHWNGRTWNYVNLPPQVTQPGNWFETDVMDAVSPSDVWLGGALPSHPGLTFLHWDGHTWSVVNGPSDEYADVKAMSGSALDMWAVGQTKYPSLGQLGPWAAHWNGHAWSVTPVPQPPTWSPGGGGDTFGGVVTFSPTDAWASGTDLQVRKGHKTAYLLEHWNGRLWSIVQGPTSEGSDGYGTISASSRTNIWAAGDQSVAGFNGDSSLPFYAHYGCSNA